VDGNHQVTSPAVKDLKLLILSKGLTIIFSPSITRKSPVHAPLHWQPVHHLESKLLRLRHICKLSDRDKELTPNPLDLKQDLETYEVEDEQENEYEYEIENKN
jgi:hypothetical protein